MTNEEMLKRIKDIFSTFKTKPILFFGSGMSQRYLSLPNWKDLLTYYAELIQPENQFAFESYQNEASKQINNLNLSNDHLYPMIATLIEKDYKDKFFYDKNFEVSLKNKYQDEIKKGANPFKYSICDYLENVKKETETLKNEIVLLSGTKNKVSNIITTNYDIFLNQLYCNYKSLVGQKHIFNNQTNSIGNIFKIHGSVENPDSILITLKDYEEFNEKSKFLSAKLLTFFIEYPIIFLGYSIGDINIRNILNDIKTCLDEETTNDLAKKMLFIEMTETETEQDIIEVELAGLRMKKVKLFDYNILYESFDSILDTIDVKTLRLLEDKIAQLIESADKNIDRVYATSLENKELTSDDLAVYIAHKSSVFDLGYSSIRLINICEDILFNNKSYDAIGILEKTIPTQKAIFNRSKIPLHKYLSQHNEKLDDFYSRNNCIVEKISDVYNASEKKTRLYIKPITKLSHITGTDDPLSVKLQNIYLSLRALDIKEVKDYIKSIWSRKDELKVKTYLTKIICVIDLIENKKEH